jgi:hypothetical protein
MLKTMNLGDFNGTTTGTAFTVGDLEPGSVCGSIDGTFSGTMTIEVSFNGSTYEQYGASVTSAKTLFGPLPGGVKLVRAHCTAYASGTISVRLGGNVKRAELGPVMEVKSGLFGDLVPTVASQSQTITAIAKSAIAADGGTNDYFVVTDGTTSTTFELKKGGGSYVPMAGRTLIDCTAITSSTDVAVAIAAAIAAAYPTTLSVPVPGSAVLTITAALGSTIKVTEHVNDSGFLVGAVNIGVAVALGECGIPQVWVVSADFVGTYAVQMSFDGGSTWANSAAPVTVSSGAISNLTTLPCRASAVRIAATTYTSGTLSARYGAVLETQV